MTQNENTQKKFKFLPMSSYLCNELCKCLDEPTSNGDCRNCAPARKALLCRLLLLLFSLRLSS